MDISNDTGQDAKYRVAGGGSPMGPHRHFKPTEDCSSWPVIPPRSSVKVAVTSKGPWSVYFVINGEGLIAESSSDNDLVQLVPSGDSFGISVQKVAHATHRPA